MDEFLRATRILVDDGDNSPLTPEEEAVMKSLRAKQQRPSKRDIAALARRLAR
jgi:hypothetical protein